MPHAIQIRQTGGPEVLNWTAVDIGEPGSGQVRQAAAGINYIDVYRRTGYYPQPLHFIPGLEGAGTVEAVAQDARGLKSAIGRPMPVLPAAICRWSSILWARTPSCAPSIVYDHAD